MNDIPKMMLADAYRESLPVDHPESLVDVELSAPESGPGDVFVRIEAIAVNPVHYKIRTHRG
ncbi:hypothetical protein ABZ705_30665 [Streptomyces sp. NPDC006984]|uniref:hypothetical protein n=1 Tax=Streptomyces sp. NPDC006984 TaxID=3155463 RepID=UPI0033E20101